MPDIETYLFPAVRVKFHGPTDHRGSRYIATEYVSGDYTARVTHPYDFGLSPQKNALEAARKCHAKVRAKIGLSSDEFTLIPGDLSTSEYVFVAVNNYMLGRS